MTEERSPLSNARISGSRGSASVKRLRSSSTANAYQREWFKELRERVIQGEPFAVVNADVPQEILRAMDIPYVVNQWWAAVCSAKQMAPYYLGLLNERGYREDLCRYCSLSLASAFDPEPEKGPWGGLPTPTLAVSRISCEAQAKIFELWARQFQVPFYLLENPVPQKFPPQWWDKVQRQWEEVFEPRRLDLIVEDYKELIRFLETETGKTFSIEKLAQVMDLVNQQSEYNRKTRDLIAQSSPVPVTITDTVPAVMVPQWQRGTQWAVDMARLLYEEVSSMAEHDETVRPKEQVRLMWLGRGLWFNLGFYQHFEQRYGAVFAWSIYLALAADGYARYGDDPLRMLASRSAGLEDMLHMPPWNSDWYVHEAKQNHIAGAVHLISDSCTLGAGGTYFVKKAFEDAGIPLLQLRADPVDARSWDESEMTRQLEDFLEKRVMVQPRSEKA